MSDSKTPAKLFGVRGAAPAAGPFKAKIWAQLRAGDNWGQMQTPEGEIIYFRDPAPRDQFADLFGGIKVTLDRTASGTITGAEAIKMAARMQS